MKIINICLIILIMAPITGRPATIIINDPATSSGYTVTSYNSSTPAPYELLIIGIYETSTDHSSQGNAYVHILHQGNIPFKLVLSAYEPTLWNLDIESGVNLTEIILNGYNEQEVSGISGIAVTNRSGPGNNFTSSAYMWPPSPGNNTQVLVSGVEEYTGLTLTAFSGVYRATDFSVITSSEPDSDGDGVGDFHDAFPQDPNELYDSDNDGIGDNADTDDDNDGLSDQEEVAIGRNPLVNEAVIIQLVNTSED